MSVFDVFNPLKKVTPRFTEDQLSEMIKWFDENAEPLLVINEEEPINVVTIEKFVSFLELKNFHRRSFRYPSYREIMTEAEYLHAGITRMLTKDQFIYILNKWVVEPQIKHELILAFKVFDTENRNFLEIDEIKGIVTGYGEAFTDMETQEILRDANVHGDGNILYEDFVESMFSNAPELYNLTAEYLYDDPDEDPSVPPEEKPVVEEIPSQNPNTKVDPKQGKDKKK